MNRRSLFGAPLALVSAGAVAQQTAMWTIGIARMEADGTLILDLNPRPDSSSGQTRFVYPPDHRDYAMILRHLGGMRPGETKAVPPF